MIIQLDKPQVILVVGATVKNTYVLAFQGLIKFLWIIKSCWTYWLTPSLPKVLVLDISGRMQDLSFR